MTKAAGWSFFLWLQAKSIFRILQTPVTSFKTQKISQAKRLFQAEHGRDFNKTASVSKPSPVLDGEYLVGSSTTNSSLQAPSHRADGQGAGLVKACQRYGVVSQLRRTFRRLLGQIGSN